VGSEATDLLNELGKQPLIHDRCETESALNTKTKKFSSHKNLLTAGISKKSDEALKQQHSSSSFEVFTSGNALTAQMQSRVTYPKKKQAVNFFATSGNFIQSSHTEE